jgi:membrane protein required for colicin V production
LNILDIILAGLLIIGAVRGYRKGIILEITGLLGLFLALFGAFQFVDWGVTFIAQFVEVNSGILPAVAFIAIFVGILVSVYLLGNLIKATFHITPFGIFDSLFGGIVGILKWALIISLLFWLIGVLEFELQNEQFQSSAILPHIILLAPYFLDFIGFLIPYFQELLISIKTLFSIDRP